MAELNSKELSLAAHIHNKPTTFVGIISLSHHDQALMKHPGAQKDKTQKLLSSTTQDVAIDLQNSEISLYQIREIVSTVL
jgi:hypothetical protein